ncbi:uncharacterized protein HMPREF1541_00113 [Cyphellophora europaea CBS 101466]|uniref:Glutamine synthetase n=1 Tax=Cyphellophora europaea (strain CBS 101466) TaxID=1220924 RepID=W2SB37_CYPE1|nr:uncharacterized protein HMPREF1541_00113 [Cyphellophora europaea CBS 101466]ETN45931.1 hypothetical protein HMPREF1541_00113 [Cyphellophora europaea CBS 101466]
MGDLVPDTPSTPSTYVDGLAALLRHDTRVKVAGIDTDGILRGKVMAKDKFLSSAVKGFGMSSAIFGWDMHDVLYTTHTEIMSAEGGSSADFIAIPDLKSFRRIPWEDGIPLFLLRYVSSNHQPVFADGRSMIRDICAQLESLGYTAKVGTELEFHNFQTPSEDGYSNREQTRDLAGFLAKNGRKNLRPLTGGMFGYSISRPAMNRQYFYDIFDQSLEFGCELEGWHTETGPGVFEAVTCLSDPHPSDLATNVRRYLTKSIAIPYHITPCFMAKPIFGLPGNSGHIHISLLSPSGNNLFARESPDASAPYPDIVHLSDLGRHFLAGLLEALPSIMPLLAPTINSYKRLVENHWAPIHVSWGLEDRMSSIRMIGPPVSSASATRFEVRIPGADLHPHYAMAAVLGAGLRGIRKKLAVPVPPTNLRNVTELELLPNTLEEAVKRFKASSSVARDILGDEFVDFYAATREHELRSWREAVTDW